MGGVKRQGATGKRQREKSREEEGRETLLAKVRPRSAPAARPARPCDEPSREKGADLKLLLNVCLVCGKNASKFEWLSLSSSAHLHACPHVGASHVQMSKQTRHATARNHWVSRV